MQENDQIQLTTRCGILSVPRLDPEVCSRLRITWHWAASAYSVSPLLRSKYHFILGRDGQAVAGVPILRNIVTHGHPREALYAPHVKNANSNNIGIAAAAMAGASEAEARRGYFGPFPMSKAQAEGLAEVAAQLCACYGVPVVPARVLGHAEWDSLLHIHQDRWDVNCIPHLDLRPRLSPGGTYSASDWLRARTAARMEELRLEAEPELEQRRLRALALLSELDTVLRDSHAGPEALALTRRLRELPAFAALAQPAAAGVTVGR